MKQVEQNSFEMESLEEKEMNEARQQISRAEQTWAEWTVQQIMNSASWVFRQLRTQGIRFSSWVVRDPHTAKIVLFIIKATMKRTCRDIRRWWYRADIASEEGKVRRFLDKVEDVTGITVDSELGKVAIQETFSEGIKHGGFDSLYDSLSASVGAVLSGVIGDIPYVGGAIKAVGNVTNDVLKDSLKFYLELSIYQRNIQFVGKQVIDIIYMVLPIKITWSDRYGWQLNLGFCEGSTIASWRKPREVQEAEEDERLSSPRSGSPMGMRDVGAFPGTTQLDPDILAAQSEITGFPSNAPGFTTGTQVPSIVLRDVPSKRDTPPMNPTTRVKRRRRTQFSPEELPLPPEPSFPGTTRATQGFIGGGALPPEY